MILSGIHNIQAHVAHTPCSSTALTLPTLIDYDSFAKALLTYFTGNK